MTKVIAHPMFVGLRAASGWRPHLIATAFLCVGGLAWGFVTWSGFGHWAIALTLQAGALFGARLLSAKVGKAQSPLAKTVPRAPAAEPRVLVVDNDQQSQRRMQSTFAENGCNVMVAATSYEALEVLRDKRDDTTLGRIALVILNIKIPDVDVKDVVQSTAGFDPRPVVVRVSGDPGGQYVVRYVGTQREKTLPTMDALALALRDEIQSVS